MREASGTDRRTRIGAGDSAAPSATLPVLAPMLALAATVLVGLPTAGLAVAATDTGSVRTERVALTRFTPANVDPALARRVAAKIAARGQELRFTPAGTGRTADRTGTFAIRVDADVAQAMAVRRALETGRGEAGRGVSGGHSIAALAPTRYDLGIARGYRTFARPAPLASAETTPVGGSGLGAGIRSGLGIDNPAIPDLASFRPSDGVKAKPSRFQGNLALGHESRAGSAPRTLEGAGEQSVDLSAGYRVTRGINVTAGVRLSQERDRLAPLTDTQRDDQAVYVGTQFRF